jgi:hypothetical protein
MLVCFDFKTKRGLTTVKRVVQDNFEASKRPDFVPRMVQKLRELQKRGVWAVRVHGGGDYYSDGYVVKWAMIAHTLPEMKFFSYTKSLRLAALPILEAQPNFTVIKSFGGIHDTQISRAKDDFADIIENANQAGRNVVVCPADRVRLVGGNRGVWCGLKCRYCFPPNGKGGRQVRVAFVEQTAGWNGMPQQAVDRLKLLAEKGLVKPSTTTQARRLEAVLHESTRRSVKGA